MFENFPFLENEYLGNTVQSYLTAVCVFVVGVVILILVEKIILRRIRAFAEKTKTTYDDYLLKIFERTILPLLYLGAFYFAVQQLALSVSLGRLITSITLVLLVIQVTRLVSAVAVLVVQEVLVKGRGQAEGSRASKSILNVVQVIVWGFGLVLLLDNLGFNVSAVIAGLGVGGIAIALAAQTILGDLFNYFVIFFDKPFKEGDFIILDDFLGVIEHIGLKSTKIRSLGGELLVFSNSDLTSSRIRNYKRMQKRRVPFKVGVTYQTSAAKMKKIPGMVKSIIEGVKDTAFDRCHFQNFGDFSLDIEAVYYVMGADYNKYMDIQQQIYLRIMEAFEKEGIEFAYPTQTLFVNKES